MINSSSTLLPMEVNFSNRSLAVFDVGGTEVDWFVASLDTDASLLIKMNRK
jgi:hypothetical protein